MVRIRTLLILFIAVSGVLATIAFISYNRLQPLPPPAPTAETVIVRDPDLPEITREMVDKSIRTIYAEPDLERYLSEPHEIRIMWNWPFDGHILVVDIVVNKGNFEAELYGYLMAKVDLDGEKIIEMNYHDRHECW